MNYTYAREHNINIDLFEQIKKVITEEPKRMDMSDWVYEQEPSEGGPACGTVACIAGWAGHLHALNQKGLGISYTNLRSVGGDPPSWTASTLLRLPMLDGVKLWYTSDWPYAFQDELRDHAHGTSEYAAVVCRRIDHYLETGL